jgi:hypothetical protein
MRSAAPSHPAPRWNQPPLGGLAESSPSEDCPEPATDGSRRQGAMFRQFWGSAPTTMLWITLLPPTHRAATRGCHSARRDHRNQRQPDLVHAANPVAQQRASKPAARRRRRAPSAANWCCCRDLDKERDALEKIALCAPQFTPAFHRARLHRARCRVNLALRRHGKLCGRCGKAARARL